MAKITSNKLMPLFAIVGLVVVGFIALRAGKTSEAVTASGSPLDAVPVVQQSAPPSEGLMGKAKDAATATAAAADADSPTETLRTLTSEVLAVRADQQRLADENRNLRTQVTQGQIDREALKNEIRSELRAEGQQTQASTPTAAPTQTASTETATRSPLDVNGLLAQLPTGFGFDGNGRSNGSTETATDATARGQTPGTMGQGMARAVRTILPMGVTVSKGAEGKDALVRTTAGVQPLTRTGSPNAPIDAASAKFEGLLPTDAASPGGLAALADAPKKKDKPFFTIPENATLLGVTAMTAIVGRIPVDGKVQDPMQFKLILGPENLAANGHFLPRDLSGVIVSGIAIGDMNLSCSEGLVQSMTFVFNDGTIRTVSMRSGGTTPGAGGGAGGAQLGLAQTPKLGYLSDRHGNPCIAGRFVTNAPAYLTDVIGLKTLSLAGKAAAMAQTTTTNSIGMGGASSTSSVTGNKSTYILGEAASGATDEVTSWLTRRMSSSFDAIVTTAGADVVVHIDQEIAIDKTTEARRIDYGRIDAINTRSQLAKASHHGLD